LNLYAAYRVDDRLSVALPMGSPWYTKGKAKPPRNPILGYRLTVDGAIDGLMQQGFAERVKKGSPWGGTFSLIRATKALVDFLEPGGDTAPITALRLAQHYDPIVLRSPKVRLRSAKASQDDPQGSKGAVPMAFAETPQTEAIRAAVHRINGVNTPDRIMLPELTEDERWALIEAVLGRSDKVTLKGKRVRQRRPPPIADNPHAWFAQTALYRVFNNGSFDLGGRFYGPSWQALPKAWRARILIDGEPMVELDFGSLHPRMAHQLLEGVEGPQDCYASINPDREIAKRAVSAMLNMENGTSRPPGWFRVEDAGMRWPTLAKAAQEALPGIARHLGTGAGLRLQRVDSDIAEAVMLHFASRNIPCLGVHDSFIVAARYADELEAVMRAAYHSRIGFEPVISRV
jgi:hypothetical protein